MIHIDRTSVAPPLGFHAGLREALDDVEARVKSGALRSRSFDRKRYGAARQTLWKAQREKCCYCEAEIETDVPVEHFRPRTTVMRSRKGPRSTGYWWLAYSFDNLFLACWSCNRCNGDVFPLAIGGRALRTRQRSMAARRGEKGLVVDPSFEPAGDRPEAHITFVWIDGSGYQVAPRESSPRGRATIDVLKLDRDALTRMRRKHYKRAIKPVIEDYQEALAAKRASDKSKAIARARGLVAKNAPFSLMARIAFREAGILY